MARSSLSSSENFSYKIVALLITLILWVIILGSKDTVVIKKVPLEFVVAQNMVVINEVPHEVEFKVSGPRLALKKFSEIREPLSIDLSGSPAGPNSVKIHSDSINVPVGVKVISIMPNTITPRLEELITKKVPVKVPLKGKAQEGFQVVKWVADPGELDVSGAKSVLRDLTQISTETIDISGLQSDLVRDVTVNVEKSGVSVPSDLKIRVSVFVKRKKR